MSSLLSRQPLMRGARPVAARPALPTRLTKTSVASPIRTPLVSARKPAPFVPVKPVDVPKPEVVAKAAAGSGATPEPEKKEDLILGYSKFTWSKIIPLGLMFFCILFNYTILRDTKDVLVVTAPGSGAEIIPFLKTWVNLPMAIAFTVGYAKLANMLSAEALFYTCVIPFIIFFGSFAAILYPMRETLHPTEFCKDLLASAGERFAGPIAILRNWTYCLFYVMAELWGSVVVSVCFWGFANQITTVEEAEGFYPLFGLGANVALIFSGQAVKYFSMVRANLPPGVDGWGVSLNGMMGMVVIGGMIICGIYWGLQRNVVPKLPGLREVKKKKKPKMSVGESFAFLAASPYIRDLATLVVAYGISINLVEVTWKSKLKAQFPNPNEYSAFMGNFSTATGIFTFSMMIAAKQIFARFGWGVAALVTPTMLLITGLLFFSLVLGSEALTPTLAGWGMTPLYAAVLVGAAQNVFSKGSKYALFDPCKEMAYIPLDDEVKVKGKAAIDVICNPLGKSGGALIQQFMIIGFGSLAASTPYLGAILMLIVLMWIKAVGSLNGQFVEAKAKADAERAAASDSESL